MAGEQDVEEGSDGTDVEAKGTGFDESFTASEDGLFRALPEVKAAALAAGP
jgi:hypothetical protein